MRLKQKAFWLVNTQFYQDVGGVCARACACACNCRCCTTSSSHVFWAGSLTCLELTQEARLSGQGSLCFPSSGITNVCHHAQLFTLVLGAELRCQYLGGKNYSNRAMLPGWCRVWKQSPPCWQPMLHSISFLKDMLRKQDPITLDFQGLESTCLY